MIRLNKSLEYTCTNEDLNAIIHGLDIVPEDISLVVGGSGDQAFAILEKGAKVFAIDNQDSQIEYIISRARSLEDRDYSAFFKVEEIGTCDGAYSYEFRHRSRFRYFSKDKRLERISDNMQNLKIIKGDVFDLDMSDIFTKIYLSNATGYGKGLNPFDSRQLLEKAASYLRSSGLIYVSNHSYLKRQNPECKDFLPGCLKLETKRTDIAKLFEVGWNPGVYKKV